MKILLKTFFLLCLTFTNAFAVEEFVVRSEASFVPTFQNRFTFMFGLNPSIQKASDLSNLTFSYGKKFQDYWLDTSLLLTNSIFSKITTNNPSATGLTNDQLIDTKSTLTTFGVGIGRETRYAQTLLPFTDLYELMAADLTYNFFKENTSGKTFTGPGMIAKFTLFKRFSEYFSAGTHFTYNLAVVKRSAVDDAESSSGRSLNMSYLSVGFDISLYL